MRSHSKTENGRATARRFEEALSDAKRKRLGQFFTGVPLGKMLAHLALSKDTRTVVDPMCGHGDLLDAVSEAAQESNIKLRRLDGIEIDQDTITMCEKRLQTIGLANRARQALLCGNSFDAGTIRRLPDAAYDLVITNPPYVRYQSQKGQSGAGESNRAGLIEIVQEKTKESERAIWLSLAKGYSGLADLSVPAWLLAGLLVRPGGKLALVVPATWRSREYGDVIRYFLLRCFEIEYIVEDTQPGWFSDALVRTHLVIARRLTADQTAKPLAPKAKWPSAKWIQVSPEAASLRSLVGEAFETTHPEAAFATWCQRTFREAPLGVQSRPFNLDQEWLIVRDRSHGRTWFNELEVAGHRDLPLFRSDDRPSLPDTLADLSRELAGPFSTLIGLGINVGQGLRTGCNRFFYVDALDSKSNGLVRIRTTSAFGSRELSVPADALLSVLRRQTEIPSVAAGHVPEGRVLDLRRWVLPEDAAVVAAAASTYRARREEKPRIMPDELAAYVRDAAVFSLDEQGGAKLIPNLSAVRTNVRTHRPGVQTPRFWYMLPDFMPRHLPQAFVARVNNETPWTEGNLDTPILVDANFSTFWSTDAGWTPSALKALLNSTWCQLLMEALGTCLGGGALKLEAAQIRRMPVPLLTAADWRRLDTEGKQLSKSAHDVKARIDAVVLAALLVKDGARGAKRLGKALAERSVKLRMMRKRIAA